jgi:hypothetical protein
MFTIQNFLSPEEKEKFRAGRILADEEIALKMIFSRQDKFTASFNRVFNSFRHLRGAPPRLSPRRNNVQALYFSANIWKLPPPTRARAGVFFVMPERAPAPTGAGGTRTYTYRKNINHDFGSGAFACGQRKAPPTGAIIVKPSPAKNILRQGDAARHCRYILRLPPVPRGPDKNTENICDEADIFADDLIFRAARGDCDDPTYWTMKEKCEKAGARHQWRLMVALPNNFGPTDFSRFAKAFDKKTAAWSLSYVLAVHAKKSVQTGAAPNLHAHILLSDRNALATPTGYVFDTQKNRALARAGMVRELRQVCADSINIALEARGAALRLTAESYAERGIVRPQGKHLGSRAHQIEQRGGITEAGKHNRALAFDERLSFLPVIHEKIIAKTMRKHGRPAHPALRKLLERHATEACKLAIFNWNMVELVKQHRRVLLHFKRQDQSALAANKQLEIHTSKRRSSKIRAQRHRSRRIPKAIAIQIARQDARQKVQDQKTQNLRPTLKQGLHSLPLQPMAKPHLPVNSPLPSKVTTPVPIVQTIVQPPLTPERLRISTPTAGQQKNTSPKALNPAQLHAALLKLHLIDRLWRAQKSIMDESPFDAARKVLGAGYIAQWQKHDAVHLRTLQTLLVGSHPQIIAALTGPAGQRVRSPSELDQLLKRYIKPTETACLPQLFDYLNTSLTHWQRIDRNRQVQIFVEQLRDKQQENWTKTLKAQKAASHKLTKDAILQLRDYWSPAFIGALDQLLPGIGEPMTKCLHSPTLTSKDIAALVQALQKQQKALELFKTAIQFVAPFLKEKRWHRLAKLARSALAREKYFEEERLNLTTSYEAKLKEALTTLEETRPSDAVQASLTIDSQGALLEAMTLLGIGSDPYFGRPAVFEALSWFSRSIPPATVDLALHIEAKKLYSDLHDLDTIWRAAQLPDEQTWRQTFANELTSKIADLDDLVPKQQANAWQSWQAIKPTIGLDLSTMSLFDTAENIAVLKQALDAKARIERELGAKKALEQARDETGHLQNIIEQKARAKAVDTYVNRMDYNWREFYKTKIYHWTRKSEQEFDRALDETQKCAARVQALSEKTDYGRKWFAEDGQHVIAQLCEIRDIQDWKYRDWSEAMCKATAKAPTQEQATVVAVSRPANNSFGQENIDRYRPIAERLREQKERL